MQNEKQKHKKQSPRKPSSRKKTPTFTERVFRVVAAIPRREALTYKEVARRAGSPDAYRAVGNILAKNYDLKIPCHRVIRSDGKTGGYNRGREKKRQLLREEKAIRATQAQRT